MLASLRFLALVTLAVSTSGCASWLRPIGPPPGDPPKDAARQSVRGVLSEAEANQQATTAGPMSVETSVGQAGEFPEAAPKARSMPKLGDQTQGVPLSGESHVEATDAAEVLEASSTAPLVPEKEARLAEGDEPITEPVVEPVVEPIEEPAELSPLIRGDQLLTRPAMDSQGVSAGWVQDLLIVEETGLVVGAQCREEPGQTGFLSVLMYRGLVWDGGNATIQVAPADTPSLELTEPFELQDSIEISGTVVDRELIIGEESSRLSVLLRDGDNLLRRLAIEPGELVDHALPELVSGVEVRATGVETRDERGKLFLPSSLTLGGETIALRDETGRVVWGDITARFVSAYSISKKNVSIVLATGETLAVEGWVFDWQEASVVRMLPTFNDQVRALPYESLVRIKTGWSTDLKLENFETLPVFMMSDEEPLPTVQGDGAEVPIPAESLSPTRVNETQSLEDDDASTAR